MSFDVNKIREDFPILQQPVHGKKRLVYLDNAASTQHPTAVIEQISDCYEHSYANVHRGIHALSEKASELYENARETIRKFIDAEFPEEVIFTSGTTASINMIAHSLGNKVVKSGDEIVLTMMEHHSNIVPWQQLANRTGATVRFVDIRDDGTIDLDEFRKTISEKTRIVSFVSISNVLGTINPVNEMVEIAKSVDAYTVIDAAQSIPHEKASVRQWNADFVCFSGHKMLGPSGVGVLYGRRELLESIPPFLGGGSMIDVVSVDGFTEGKLPAKFEAGTPPIVQAIALGRAIDYLNSIGIEKVSEWEKVLTERALDELSEITEVKILGTGRDQLDQRAGIVSFIVEGFNSQDISFVVDRQGIAIRAGHHCAMPLHKRLGIPNSCRASFYLYNTLEEVSFLAEGLKAAIKKLS